MRKDVRYVLTDPTGNSTVLVETPVPVEKHAAVATALMACEPTAEQVGFLAEGQNTDAALRMAGGEFCANATMSAAALCAMRTGKERVTVEVSGTKEPVPVEIWDAGNGLWQGTVTMPRPLSVDSVLFADGQTCPVVTFNGISHLILEREMPRDEAQQLAKRRCAELRADALGLMFYSRAQSRLTPLVYVPRADTLFWETSCGSGTAAVGAWSAKQSGQAVTLSLRQPGGTLEITASPDGPLYLRGTVRCVYEKTAAIDF